jgi:hypothetical protein
MHIEIDRGSLSAALGLVGGGLVVAFPNDRWIGFVLVVLGVLVFFLDIHVHRGQLAVGHYWFSVIANMDFEFYGIWGWEVNGMQNGKQALWQNPAGGYEICRTWGTIEDCVGDGPDFMFTLRGSSK